MRKRRLAYSVVFGCAALLVVGVAYAALPFSGANDNTISGCYSTGGNLKVLTPSEPTCPKGYTPIQWNVSGPQGLQGPQGPQVPRARRGPQAPLGSATSTRRRTCCTSTPRLRTKRNS